MDMGFAAAKKPDAYGRDEIEHTEQLYVSNDTQDRPVTFGRLLYEHPSCRMHPAWCVVCSLGRRLGKLSVLDCVYIIPEKEE